MSKNHNFNPYAAHLNREHIPVANPQDFDQGSFSDVCMSEGVSVPSCSHTMDPSKTNLDTPMGLPLSGHCDCAALYVAKIYSSSNSTLTNVQKSITCTKETLEKTLDSLKEKTACVLNSYNILNDEAVQSLMQDFSRDRYTLQDVQIFFWKTLLFQTYRHFLGYRGDTAWKQGKLTQVLAADTCQYISIIDTIKFLFGSEKMQKLYKQWNKSVDGKMHDYCDGTQLASHKLYFLLLYCILL